MTERGPNEDMSPAPQLKKAVALKYSPGTAAAPVVTAKGRGYVADAILNKAREHGVPVQEDASLVEVLSKLDIDQEIPPELYQLVAELLSFIYRSDRKLKELRSSP
ncbi:EscU/YscU/HrcU family type III secretion system export apparatus switch protein [Paenibacillus chartarius]|uniref:EscU/YscU/HrcU family type III secretion system export apparatus switch protein n=1 Tax=Paenibacillus chartarius TaxID=747481 RepID=A0ABV6DNU8_9BACL